MKYVLDQENIVIAIHTDDQDITTELYPNCTIWQTDEIHELGEKVTITYTLADYDRAMEKHLLTEREARGYTAREPDSYINSSVTRWKQDAQDWVAHKDAVMLYGLEIENKYAAGESVPTLAEFKAALPKIQWSMQC